MRFLGKRISIREPLPLKPSNGSLSANAEKTRVSSGALKMGVDQSSLSGMACCAENRSEVTACQHQELPCHDTESAPPPPPQARQLSVDLLSCDCAQERGRDDHQRLEVRAQICAALGCAHLCFPPLLLLCSHPKRRCRSTKAPNRSGACQSRIPWHILVRFLKVSAPRVERFVLTVVNELADERGLSKQKAAVPWEVLVTFLSIFGPQEGYGLSLS